jgi:hypothetical protein
MPWYFSPRVLVIAGLLPAYLAIWLANEVFELRLSTAKGFNFFHGEAFLAGLVGLLALAYGTLLPVHVFSIRDPRRRGLVPPIWFIQAVGLLALIGYVYWFKDIILHPGRWLELIRDAGAASYAVRGNLERSAGIASLASLGVAFFALVSHLAWVVRAGQLPLSIKALTALLALLTIFRSIAWAERLAVFEALFVVGLFWLAFSDRASRGWIALIKPAMPIMAMVGVVVIFGAGEYFRSWTHYSNYEADYWSFIGQRLVNYYFQALNTGAGMISVLDWPTYQFSHTLEWLHKFPVLLGPITRYLTQAEPNLYLERFGDPEFNNPSGLFTVLLDVGLAPAIAIFALTGLLAQSAYRAFQDRANIMGLFFPVFFLALIELFRYWYLGNSRSFLVVLALVLAALLARPQQAMSRT